MKIASLISPLFFSNNIFDQISFIGHHKEKVIQHWALRVSSDFFYKGTYDDPQEDKEWFMISVKLEHGSMEPQQSFTPEFSADFINGMCENYTFAIFSRDISVYTARFNQEFRYSKRLEGWVDIKRGGLWRIGEDTDDPYIYVVKL